MTVLASYPSVRADEINVVLARMREASGIQSLEGVTKEFLIQGESNEFDAPAPYSLRFTKSGKFLRRTEGPLGDARGFNGTTCWKIDKAGIYRTMEMLDREMSQLLFGLHTGVWLANTDPANIKMATDNDDPQFVMLDIQQGRMKARLWVDRENWLPSKMKWTGVGGDSTWLFSEYRDDLGWKVPGKIVTKGRGELEYSHVVQSISLAPPEAPEIYDPVPGKTLDVHFDSSVPARLELKRAVTGHVLVRPKINGADLGWFIFDTGAGGSTIVHSAAVAQLNVTPVGKSAITSFNGTVGSTLARGETLEIGPVTIEKPLLLEMDLSFLHPALGSDVMGIIGYDLLSRCVAEIRLGDDTIELYDPEHYRLDKGDWQKLTFHQNLPLVPAAFAGGKGLFRIDVGASTKAASNVLFHATIVSQLNLLKDREVTMTQIGDTRIAVGKLPWFELAGHRFEEPDVIFAVDRTGPVGGDEYVDGNVGVEFMKPFRIVLDYQRERVAMIRLGKE